MREIVGKAYTELGRELYEAQQRLAGNNQHDGVFESWFTYLGWKKRTVYNLIDRYTLVQNLHDQKRDLIEDLPVSLTYEIAKPSAESTPAKAQAKAEVLAGEIDTLKEYRERVKQLEKEAEQERKRAEQAERYAEEKENEVEQLKSRPKPEPRVEVRTEYVEVEDQKTRERLRKYEERFGDIEDYEREGATRITNAKDVTGTDMMFSRNVRDLVKRFSHLKTYKSELHFVDEITKREYQTSVNALQQLVNDLTVVEESTDTIIDIS